MDRQTITADPAALSNEELIRTAVEGTDPTAINLAERFTTALAVLESADLMWQFDELLAMT